MEKDVLKLSYFKLLIDKRCVNKNDFTQPVVKTVLTIDGKTVRCDLECGDQYLWLVGEYGMSLPHSDEVVNIDNNELVANPRTPNLVELRNQWFAIYYFPTETLYMTRGAKGFVMRFLSNLTKNSVEICNIYKDKDEFLKTLEKVKEVRFIEEENLFTHSDSLFSELKDACGLGNPKQINVRIGFDYVTKTAGFVKWLNSSVDDHQQGKLKHLAVAGLCREHDELVESTFNINHLEQALVCRCKKNANGTFNPDDVKYELLAKLQGEG